MEEAFHTHANFFTRFFFKLTYDVMKLQFAKKV